MDRVNYGLVGLFVAAMLGLSLYVLDLITGTDGPTDPYSVVYQNVTGLTRGAQVTFEGFPVGKVVGIEPVFEPGNVHYRVSLAVRRAWPIPADSVARLASSGFISALSVDISEGDDPERLQPGATIAGREQANLLAVVDEVAADFRALTQEGIKPALAVVTTQVERLVSELAGLSQHELAPLLSAGRERVQDLNTIFDQAGAVLASVERVSQGLEAMFSADNQAQVGRSLTQVAEASTQLNRLVSDLTQTRQGMDKVLREAEHLLADNGPALNASLKGMESATNDLGKVARVFADRIDSIVHNLDGTARHLNEFARTLREQPSVIFSGGARSEEGRRSP